jgi:acyl dehydratase
VQDQTSAEQAMVFRLSGDYNPLHIGESTISVPFSLKSMPILSTADPAIGKAAGFGGTILHGLSTFGFGARALIKAIGGGDPRSLKFFGVRFTSPVKPGDALETEAWEVGPGPEGTIEVAFVTKDLTSNKVPFQSLFLAHLWKERASRSCLAAGSHTSQRRCKPACNLLLMDYQCTNSVLPNILRLLF